MLLVCMASDITRNWMCSSVFVSVFSHFWQRNVAACEIAFLFYSHAGTCERQSISDVSNVGAELKSKQQEARFFFLFFFNQSCKQTCAEEIRQTSLITRTTVVTHVQSVKHANTAMMADQLNLQNTSTNQDIVFHSLFTCFFDLWLEFCTISLIYHKR